MDLSVVVPTLNGRDKLAGCLDSLSEHAPDAELIVVNGPSADGTTGMVREREEVDVLVEISDRNVNVARNAGIETATGDVVALVGYDLAVESGWTDAVLDTFGEEAASVVTGPTHRSMPVGMTTEDVQRTTVAGREVTFFNADNVAFTREAIEAVDGFDEALVVGGGRDCSHRVAGLGGTVVWNGDMCVRGEFGADGGTLERDWSNFYRGLTYQLIKNYGVHPGVAWQLLWQSIGDGRTATRRVVSGDLPVSSWLGGMRAAVTGTALGTKDGLVARLSDRNPRRNPNGLSARDDRAVRTYDWR